MRRLLLLAVVLSGAVQAATISETLTGTTLGTLTDYMNIFGGGSLAADEAVTFSFSYDPGLLAAAASGAIGGSYYDASPGAFDYYWDLAGDNAVSMSITINSGTFAVSSATPGYAGQAEGCTTNCGGTGSANLLMDAETTVPSVSDVYFSAVLFSNQTYYVGQVFDQTSVDALVNNLNSGSAANLILRNYNTDRGVAEDDIALGNLAPPSAPEPGTWVSLALGLGGVGLLKRLRLKR